MYRILIVDSPRVAREIQESLDWQSFGFEYPAQASNFSEGLDLARLLQPQLVLVGLELGEWMGYEFIARLREAGSGAISCLMAPHMDMDDVRRAMRSGCRDYLKRPPDSHALKDLLEWVLVQELRVDRPRGRPEDYDPVLGRSQEGLSRSTRLILMAVRTDYRQSLSLTNIARGADMSSKYIGRVFLRETGMRFTEYLMAYRMEEAKRLIQGTAEKISVIASLVGYSQLNNFYTHFRHYFGMSPSSLRSVRQPEEVTL